MSLSDTSEDPLEVFFFYFTFIHVKIYEGLVLKNYFKNC